MIDKHLQEWRDAAVAGGLPVPVRDSRWQALRAGVVNLWEFETCEYWYADGWAQLTGSNETGKSSLMALTTLIPWLADTSSRNIDTLGRTGKSFRYYIEPTGSDNDRRPREASTYQGWLWVEYGIQTDDGPRFFTTMLFAEARTAAAQPTLRWCTLSGASRVRLGCELLVDRQVVAPKNITATGFLEHSTATAYKEYVAANLLGSSAERLELVGRLLRVTRTPKLGEQLEIGFIQARLREALPELSASEIRQLADGWDQLDEVRADLDLAKEAVELVAAFAEDAWRPWARAKIRRAADLASSARTEFDTVTRTERQAKEKLDRVSEQDRTLETRERDLAQDESSARAAAEQLRASASYQDAASRVQNLKHARDDLARAKYAEAKAADVVLRAQAEVRGAKTELAKTEETAAAAEEHHGNCLDRLRTAVVAAGLAPQAVVDPVLVRQQVADRRRHVEDSKAKVRAFERAAQQALQAEESAVRSSDNAAEACARAEKAWAQAEVERDALAVRLDAWAGALTWPVDVEPWQAVLPAAAAEPGRLAEWIRGWHQPLHVAATLAHASAEERARGARAEADSLDAEISRLREAGATQPDAPTLWLRRSRPQQGAPLWRLVNPRTGFPEGELASVEAAFAAAGLLDAWVSAEGVVLDDAVVVAAPPVQRSLAEVLDAAPGPWAEMVSQFLRGVHLVYVGEELPEGNLAVALDGRWRNSGVRGHARPRHGQAEWIGEAAREAQRARRITELTQRREEQRAAAQIADAEAEEAAREIAALDRALEHSPTDAELRRLLTVADTQNGQAERLKAMADRDQRDAQDARAQANQLQAVLLEFVNQRALPATLEELDEVNEALRLADLEIAALAEATRRLVAAQDAIDHARRSLDRYADALQRAETELAGAASTQANAAAAVAALEQTLGADDQQILSQLERLNADVLAAADKVRTVGDQRRILAHELGTAKRELESVQEHRQQATQRRDATFAAFRSLVDAGFADGLELPEAESSGVRQVRDQVTEVRRQVRLRGWHESEEDDDLVARAWSRLRDRTHETRGHLEAGGRSLRIEGEGAATKVFVTVDAGSTYELDEAVRRLATIHQELSDSYDLRVRETLAELLGSTFLEHLRTQVGQTEALVASINAVLRKHVTNTDRTELRIKLDPLEASTGVILEAVRGSQLEKTEVADQVRAFLRERVDEAKRQAQAEGDSNWREKLAQRLDYRSWYSISLEQRRAGGSWGALTPRGYAQLSGGARVVMLMLPLVATLAAMYSEMPRAPRPLWLDEAFDGLDAANRATVMRLFREFDFDVLLAGPGRIVNVSAVPAAAIYQVVRAPAPEPGADLMLELWAGGQLEAIERPSQLTGDVPTATAPEAQEALL